MNIFVFRNGIFGKTVYGMMQNGANFMLSVNIHWAFPEKERTPPVEDIGFPGGIT